MYQHKNLNNLYLSGVKIKIKSHNLTLDLDFLPSTKDIINDLEIHYLDNMEWIPQEAYYYAIKIILKLDL